MGFASLNPSYVLFPWVVSDFSLMDALRRLGRWDFMEFTDAPYDVDKAIRARLRGRDGVMTEAAGAKPQAPAS